MEPSKAFPRKAAARISELESKLAERGAENALLRSRLATLELDRAAGSSTAANADSHGSGKKLIAADFSTHKTPQLVAGNGSDDAEAPVFPPEIFLLIASHLNPGSKTLATLSSASKALNKLLDPLLVAEIHLDWWDSRPPAPAELVARGRLQSIRELDLGSGFAVRRTGLDRGEPVIRGCTSLRKLVLETDNSYDLECLLKLCEGSLNSLQVLEIDVVEDLSDSNMDEGTIRRLVDDIGNSQMAKFAPHLPQLRELEISGNYLPNFTDLLISSSPALSELRAKVYIPTGFRHLGELSYGPGFLGKVTSWTVTGGDHYDGPVPLEELVKEPRFRPRSIYVAEVGESDIDAMKKIPPLQELCTGRINVTALSRLGLLPALKSLDVYSVPLNWDATGDQLAAVKWTLFEYTFGMELGLEFDYSEPTLKKITAAALWIEVAESRPHTALTVKTNCTGFRNWKATVDLLSGTSNNGVDIEACRVVRRILDRLGHKHPVLMLDEVQQRGRGEYGQYSITI